MVYVRSNGGRWHSIAQSGRSEAKFSSVFRSTFGDGLSHPLASDLADVGQAAFLADRFFRRSRRLGERTRLLEVRVPVSNVDVWSNVGEFLNSVVGFASQDRWRFHFTNGQRKVSPRPCPALENASVNLFSDGLDSLCGAAAALHRGETLVAVSHNPPGFEAVQALLAKLRTGLHRTGQEVHCANFAFRVDSRTRAGKRSMFPERSRLTRPFLYLSMAGSVAMELGVARICLNENSLLALNLPLSKGHTGTDITRHAHPEMLRRFRELMAQLMPQIDWVVENPLAGVSKGEAMRQLGGAIEMAKDTVTCPASRQQMAACIGRLRKSGLRLDPPPRECGICVPCIVRRSAFAVRMLPEKRSHYVFQTSNQLRQARFREVRSLFAGVANDTEDLREFADGLKRTSARDFFLEYLPEIALAADPSQDIAAETRRIFDFCKRSAREILTYLNQEPY